MTATDRSGCAARAMEERDGLLGKNVKGGMESKREREKLKDLIKGEKDALERQRKSPSVSGALWLGQTGTLDNNSRNFSWGSFLGEADRGEN